MNHQSTFSSAVGVVMLCYDLSSILSDVFFGLIDRVNISGRYFLYKS